MEMIKWKCPGVAEEKVVWKQSTEMALFNCLKTYPHRIKIIWLVSEYIQLFCNKSWEFPNSTRYNIPKHS